MSMCANIRQVNVHTSDGMVQEGHLQGYQKKGKTCYYCNYMFPHVPMCSLMSGRSGSPFPFWSIFASVRATGYIETK